MRIYIIHNGRTTHGHHLHTYKYPLRYNAHTNIHTHAHAHIGTLYIIHKHTQDMEYMFTCVCLLIAHVSCFKYTLIYVVNITVHISFIYKQMTHTFTVSVKHGIMSKSGELKSINIGKTHEKKSSRTAVQTKQVKKKSV